MLIACDRTATKNEIRDALLDMAAARGKELTLARANNLADKFKKGLFDPDLAYLLDYADPTGERAVRNILEAAAA